MKSYTQTKTNYRMMATPPMPQTFTTKTTMMATPMTQTRILPTSMTLTPSQTHQMEYYPASFASESLGYMAPPTLSSTSASVEETDMLKQLVQDLGMCDEQLEPTSNLSESCLKTSVRTESLEAPAVDQLPNEPKSKRGRRNAPRKLNGQF